MDRIVYIGNEPKFVELTHCIKEIEIVAIVFEEKKKDLFIGKTSTLIPCYSVSNKKNLANVMKRIYGSVDYVVMYSFGIIIPSGIINNIDIYNFHAGDLRTNRGSSPINWSILNHDNTTRMSLHKIDEKIDCGELVSEHMCKIYDADVPCTLKARMEGEIPSMMRELYDYVHDKRAGYGCIPDGYYRNRITAEDYTISEYDSEDTIKAKISSQYDYEGAVIIDGSRKMTIKTWNEYCEVKDRHMKGIL